MMINIEWQKKRGFVNPIANRPVVVIPVVAFFHFVMHLVAVGFSSAASVKHFENGAEPTVGVQILDTLVNLLAFPLVVVIQQLPIGGTGHWGWLIFLANSSLWGLATSICLRRISKPSITGQGVATPSPSATRMP